MSASIFSRRRQLPGLTP